MHAAVDAGVQAEGQAEAAGVDVGHDAVQLVTPEGRDMQHRAEYLAGEVGDAELARLEHHLYEQLDGTVQVEVRRLHDCGFGPPLDHERKFVYVA